MRDLLLVLDKDDREPRVEVPVDVAVEEPRAWVVRLSAPSKGQLDLAGRLGKDKREWEWGWEWELGSGCAALTEGTLFTRGWYAKASDRGGLGGRDRDSEKGDRESVTNAENCQSTRR